MTEVEHPAKLVASPFWRACAVLICCAIVATAKPAFAQAMVPPSSSAEQQAQLEAHQKKLEELEKEQARRLKELRQRASPGSPEMQKAEEELYRRIERENRVSKRGYVSPSTRDVELAAYYTRFAARIECVGNKRYTDAFKGKAVRAVATTSVFSDGRLEKVEIDVPSGSAEFDAVIAKIARAAVPFPKFSPELRQRFAILSLTTVWTFGPSDEKPLTDC